MKKSEFGFIGDIAKMFATLPHHGFEPIGDDCTVLPMGDEALVMTTDMLIEDVNKQVAKVDGVESVDVILTFDPVWDKSMMSEEALLELNLL